jgi:integrase
MAWIYKRGGVWWVGYRTNSKQVLRSLKTTDEKTAKAGLAKVNTMFSVRESGSVLQELYETLSGKRLPRVTLAGALNDWLEECAGSTGRMTSRKYQTIAEELKSFLGASDSAPMLVDVETEMLRGFLVQKRKTTSASTVNGYRKILSVFFIRALKNGQLKSNPVLPIKPFKAGQDEGQARRAFTIEEIQLLYSKAPDPFWQYMIVCGFYSGQRMGDLITLRWGSVDFQERILRITTGKTGRQMKIPMAARLYDLLAQRRGEYESAKPTDFVWPEQGKEYLKNRSGSFSNSFYEIMTTAGLTTARTAAHRAHKNGRSAKRAASTVSFHCLRHSFVSLLKVTGSNQAVAKELAGHSSNLISDNYTHIPPEILAHAIKQLPEITL